MVSNSNLPESPMRGFRVVGSVSVEDSALSAASNFASAEDSHPTDDAPDPDAGQTWGEIVNRCTFSNLGERGIRQNQIRQIANIERPCQRENPHCDQLTCLCADNCNTHYLTFFRRDDFYVAARFTLCLRAIIVVIGPARHTNPDPSLARPRFRKPGLGKLGIGKSDPRNEII